MIPGELKPYPGKQWVFTGSGPVTAKHGGLWHPIVTRSDPIKKGQVTGYIKDLKGDVLEEVLAPVDGIVHALYPSRVVFRGELVYTWRTIEEAWKD
jgi:predicted deacylase